MLEKAEQYDRLVKEFKELKSKKDKLDHCVQVAEFKIKKQRSLIENAITENGFIY